MAGRQRAGGWVFVADVCGRGRGRTAVSAVYWLGDEAWEERPFSPNTHCPIHHLSV
jgi:hypothetical protein